MVLTNPMVSATSARRGLELLPYPASKISPSKQRLVARAVFAARLQILQPFSHGEKFDGEESSLTRLSEKIYLHTLVEEQNLGVKHLELHQLVCVGHQFKDSVTLGCYSTTMLLLHPNRAGPAALILDGLSLQASILLLGSPARNSN
jgi:hypothetical protein